METEISERLVTLGPRKTPLRKETQAALSATMVDPRAGCGSERAALRLLADRAHDQRLARTHAERLAALEPAAACWMHEPPPTALEALIGQARALNG